MTLRARDEADIVGSWLDFHLSAGAEFVVVTDHRSQDGTTEILERYAREGSIHLIREPGEELREEEWVTRMARVAATEYGADWVINSDETSSGGRAAPRWAMSSRQFRSATGQSRRSFARLCRAPGAGCLLADDRVVLCAGADPRPGSLYRPIRKVIHRAHAEIRLARGNHAVTDSPFLPLRGRFPVELFHFPVRTGQQMAHKADLFGNAFAQYVDSAPTGYHRNMFQALRDGGIADYFNSLVVDEAELERGVAEGRLWSTRGFATRYGRLQPDAPRRFRSRRSSRTPSTPSRRRCLAKQTSCGSSGGSTSSNGGSARSRSGSSPGSTARSRVRRGGSYGASGRRRTEPVADLGGLDHEVSSSSWGRRLRGSSPSLPYQEGQRSPSGAVGRKET